jgi:RimJ/RimL family protein N-acetyltransferase
VIPAVLRTPRLVLRPVEPRDAAAIHEALADWQVVKWLSRVPWPYTPEDARAFTALAAPGGPLDREGERTWAVTLAGQDRFVGIMGLGTGPGQELGYWLAQEAWGRGLAPEAARAVLGSHFAHDEAPDVLSGYFDGNERSGRVLAKLGFVEEGVERRGCLARGEDVTSHRMRLTRAALAA